MHYEEIGIDEYSLLLLEAMEEPVPTFEIDWIGDNRFTNEQIAEIMLLMKRGDLKKLAGSNGKWIFQLNAVVGIPFWIFKLIETQSKKLNNALN